jgi:hypothetical protein
MRQTMGMLNEADPLPVPRLAQSSTADDTPWTVPDWGAPIGDEANQRVREALVFVHGVTANSLVDQHNSAKYIGSIAFRS